MHTILRLISITPVRAFPRICDFIFDICVNKFLIVSLYITGYELYISLINDDMLLEVEKTSRILWYYLFTYGLTFLIVTIAIAIDPFVYTRADYCVWMEQTSVFYSTLIVPIIIFIAVSV